MLKEKIEKTYTEALKLRDEFVVGILRILKSAFQNAEIAKRPAVFTDDDALKVIKSEVKKLQDALVDFLRGGRKDLIEKAQKEIQLLKQYLPEELSPEAVEEIVRRVVSVMKPSGAGDFGKVMGAAMKEAGGRANGDMVSKIVRKLIGL